MDSPQRLFQLPEMQRIFSAEETVRQMLVFEAALARAQAGCGVIPSAAAESITAACRVELFDVASIYRDASSAGTLAIPLVRALTERAGDAGGYVHWGATSQDVIDTMLMLQMRDGLGVLMTDMRQLAAACAHHAHEHRLTIMPGRTLLQQATPISFGLKAARWLALTVRHARAILLLRNKGLALQFGGAAGTLAALGDRASQVAAALGSELNLVVPSLPWHAERDRTATIASTLGVAAGGMEKIATDIVLLAQTEVGEVSESRAEGKGESSAMPQKRNPVDATSALAAARLCLANAAAVITGGAHEHERAAGAWQAECVALPDIFCYAAGAVRHVMNGVGGLEVHVDRMRQNLDRDGAAMAESLSMALAGRLGRPEAQKLTRKVAADAVENGRGFVDQARDDDRVRQTLAADELDRALDPASYLGSTNRFIDSTLAEYQAIEREPL